MVDDDGVRLLQQFVKSVGNVAELHSLALEYLNEHTPTITVPYNVMDDRDLSHEKRAPAASTCRC